MNILKPDEAGMPMVSGRSARWDLATVSLILIALAVWMLCHQYRGIVHDNRIYALLAFNYIDPTAFVRDVFLKHGSQDSFTIFSPLYAGAITLLGLDWSSKLLVIFGQALWLLGAFLLARKVMAPQFTWLALLFLAAFPPHYGGNSVFAIGEGFVSPRLYTEALGLLAIAAFLGARIRLAGLLVIMGSLLHPLMMAAPAAVILLLAILRNRPWWTPVPVVAAGSLLLLGGLAAVHLSGLSILPTIDPEWRLVVRHRTGQLMLTNWTVWDWLAIACDAVLVCLACIKATQQVRQLLVTVLAIGLASVIASFVAFDLLDDVTTGKAQIWRALWLLHVMAPIALALLVQDITQRADENRTLLLILAFAYPFATFLCNAANLPPFGASILVLFGTFYARSAKAEVASTPRDRLLIGAGIGVLLTIVLAQVVSSFLTSSFTIPTERVVWLQRVLVCILLLVSGLLVLKGLPSRRKLVATLAVLSVLVGMLQWDIRGQWRRYMDSAPDIASELSVPVMPGELVYWPGDVMATWGALGNPSFYNDIQGAGAIFNRDTALAFLRRLKSVAAFEPYSPWTEALMNNNVFRTSEDGTPKVGLDDLASLCAQADHPDVVVLAQEIPGAKREAWSPPVPYSRVYAKFYLGEPDNPSLVVGRTKVFFFYRCRDLHEPEAGLERRRPAAETARSLCNAHDT